MSRITKVHASIEGAPEFHFDPEHFAELAKAEVGMCITAGNPELFVPNVAAPVAVPAGGRDLATVIAEISNAWRISCDDDSPTLASHIAAELTRLGWVHGGAGGARLSEEAISAIRGALEYQRGLLDGVYPGRTDRVLAEIEALPRVGVRT